MKKIEIFTDGSCLGNPGKGGYGVILRYQKYEKILSKGYYLTTNNRMELMAIISSLEELKENCNIVLSTDSQYVYFGVTNWIKNWKKYNWKSSSSRKDIKNIDLWKRLTVSLDQHKIHWKWIKGHAGCLENERCDKLAKMAALNPTQKDIFPENN